MYFKERAKIYGNNTKKDTNNGVSLEELDSELNSLIKKALEEGNLYTVLRAYMKLGDRKGVRVTGEKLIQRDSFFDAYKAFEYLNDKEGMLKILKREHKVKDFLKEFPELYLNLNNVHIYERFKEWASTKGINVYYLELVPVVNMAYHKAKDYDLGIGIARGGLLSAYIFNLFGLPVKITQSHRKGKGATFEWIDETSQEDFEGKRIVVFDKDVKSGRTTKRVLREIQKYKPESIDLILNHDPVDGLFIGTNPSGIPDGFNAVYYPKDFNYQELDKALDFLVEKLRYE